MSFATEMMKGELFACQDVPEPILLTITETYPGKYSRDNKPYLGLRFSESDQALALSPRHTNLKEMITMYGPDERGWIGKKIVLYCDPNVEFPVGVKVGGLRVRAPKPQKVAKPEPDLNDDIPF